MRFGRDILGDYRAGTNREYLITNGMGSFSKGSINGNSARRYSGLLVSSFMPPQDRYLIFQKIEEEFDGVNLSCSKQNYGKESIKDGYKYLESFEQNPFPKFRYSVNGNILEKEIFMAYEKELVIVEYKLIASSKESVELKLNLQFNYRDTHKMSDLKIDKYKITDLDNGKKIVPKNELKPSYIYSNALDSFEEEQFEIKNIVYDIEVERGDNSLDNSYNIGNVSKNLKEGESIYILVSMAELKNHNVEELRNEELERLNSLKDRLNTKDEFLKDLAIAGDTFIVHRKGTNGKTILAGYPWFADWGRDTMIALPGLTLAANRFDDAQSILKTFSLYCSEGMLPNKFPDFEGEKLYYNTIDASLWYFYAVERYIYYTGDYDFIKKEIFKSMQDIIDYHINGTRFNIKLDKSDGLISGGDRNTQLTWMDVGFKGWAVTPRFGKAVEINALWYNALKVMKLLYKEFEMDFSSYNPYIKLFEENFENKFWNEKDNCLYDYIADGVPNSDIRPNQIFAISLPYSSLSEEVKKSVVDSVTQKLYTSNGLRSLSVDNENYIGIYQGDLFERDSSYHQGTVWGWPIGHYLSAHYKVYQDKNKIELFMAGLKNHFYNDACIKNVSEIFDGDAPFKPRGCNAQAWSVSELIRVIREDLEK